MEYVVLGFPVGNTVVGKIVSEDDRSITIDAPAELLAVPMEGGKVQMTMVPYKFIFADAADKTVTISKNKPMFIKDLADFPQLLEGYKNDIMQKANATANNADSKKPKILVDWD